MTFDSVETFIKSLYVVHAGARSSRPPHPDSRAPSGHSQLRILSALAPLVAGSLCVFSALPSRAPVSFCSMHGVPTDHRLSSSRSRRGHGAVHDTHKVLIASSLFGWRVSTSSSPDVFQTWPAHEGRGRGGESVTCPGLVHGSVSGASSSQTAAQSPQEKSIARA